MDNLTARLPHRPKIISNTTGKNLCNSSQPTKIFPKREKRINRMFKIFDNPWGLLTIAVVPLLAVLIIRSLFPDKHHWWQFAIPLALAIAAFGLDFLVQTDLEKIKATLYAAAKAVETENPNALELTLSENYHDSFHQSKQALMRNFTARLSRPLIEKNIISILQTDIAGPNATVLFTVRVVFDDRSFVAQNYKKIVLAKVKMNLEKRHKKWLISQVELLELDLQPMKWKDVQNTNW